MLPLIPCFEVFFFYFLLGFVLVLAPASLPLRSTALVSISAAFTAARACTLALASELALPSA